MAPRYRRRDGRSSRIGVVDTARIIGPTDDRLTSGPGFVRRTLGAIEMLAQGPMTREELAKALDVHGRTAIRMLTVMEESDWVTQEPGGSGAYILTPRIVEVARSFLGGMNLAQTGLPFVRRLRDQFNEAAHVYVPSFGGAVQVIEEPSPHPLAVTLPLGSRAPWHASAVGKALAAYIEADARPDYGNNLERFTPNTITSASALARELEGVRARGYAVDDEELYIGTRCVSAPVRDNTGRVVASIGVSGPTVRLTRERIDAVAGVVTEVARELSAALGWVGRDISTSTAQTLEASRMS